MMTFSGQKTAQRPDELAAFCEVVAGVGATSYLEIGSRYGDAFHSVVCTLPPGSRAVCVDLAGEAWGRKDSAPFLEAAAADLRLRGYSVTVVFGDSRSPEVVQAVRNFGPFDAVMIDGDHRYDGVRADWLNYGPMVSPRGVVAFHDTDAWHKNSHPKIQVPKLWRELKAVYGPRAREIVGRERAMGIGVIWPS